MYQLIRLLRGLGAGFCTAPLKGGGGGGAFLRVKFKTPV